MRSPVRSTTPPRYPPTDVVANRFAGACRDSSHTLCDTTGRLVLTLGAAQSARRSRAITRRKGVHEQLVEVVEGELDSRRGTPGPGRRVLLRPHVPVQSAVARPVPGTDGCTAGAAARSYRDRGADAGRPGAFRRLPPCARPRP